jgi:ribosomal protein L7/L12
MGPTQRKLMDLENTIDEMNSYLKLVEERIVSLEKKDNPKVKTYQETIPPQSLDTIEVVKAICHFFKYTESRIKDLSDTCSFSCKIGAVKMVRSLTNMCLKSSKELVDKYWDAHDG